jgi:hypothetical protein
MYHWENKIHFGEMTMSTLCYTSMLIWSFIMLTNWNTVRLIRRYNSDLETYQFYFYLLLRFLTEKQHIPILRSFVCPERDSNPMSYHPRGELLHFNIIQNVCTLQNQSIWFWTEYVKTNLHHGPHFHNSNDCLTNDIVLCKIIPHSRLKDRFKELVQLCFIKKKDQRVYDSQHA